ncbi:MAG: valine--tRNA ligase [Desulfurococcaceae archaeon]
MSSGIVEKRWDRNLESAIFEKWIREGLHKFNYIEGLHRGIIVFDTPPPYASGKLHIGQAASYIHMDALARYFRLKNYAVLIPFYSDRNGLPVEILIEKQYGINPHEVSSTPEGRENFLKLCSKHLDSVLEDQIRVFKKLGCLFDYWMNGTDSEEYRKYTQASFIKLYRAGLIYEDYRPVNYCPRCRTALAEAEIEYVEEEGYLYYIRFDLVEKEKSVVVATTRPELLRACKALVYHPNDERYRGLEGLHAINPLYGYTIPIMMYHGVDPGFGTGIVMICSYGDQNDVRIFRELGLEPTVIIDRDGRLTSEAGELAGLDIKTARLKAVELLEKKGYLVNKVKIKHNVPVCWRCKTPVEIINCREWFLKQLDFRPEIIRIAENLRFIPEFHRVRLLEWINSLTMDWPISRDRYYATEIPVWRCRKCGEIHVPEPGRYYRTWAEPAPWNQCTKCGAPREYLEGEKKVFDTWFDSSITVLYVTRYFDNPELFEKAIKIRPQGYEIIRTWLYYSLLRVYQLTGKQAFDYVRINGMGLDEKGEAMHKSKGNIIDPEPVVEKYGADAVRFWSAIASRLGYDYRYSEQVIRTGSLFVTKLWNIARFASSFPVIDKDYVLREIDKQIIAYTNKVVKQVDEAYSKLDVYEPINTLYQFTWNVFASHYIELVKSRAYNEKNNYSVDEQRGAWYTIHYVLKRILLTLHPIMPFVTDHLYSKLYGVEIYREVFPEAEKEWLSIDTELLEVTMDINSEIWSYKKKNGLRLSDPIRQIVYLPSITKPVLDEIRDLHRIEKLEIYDDKPPENTLLIGKYVAILKT